MKDSNRRIVFVGVKGKAIALDRASGQEVWRTELKGGAFVNLVLDGHGKWRDLLSRSRERPDPLEQPAARDGVGAGDGRHIGTVDRHCAGTTADPGRAVSRSARSSTSPAVELHPQRFRHEAVIQ